VSESVAIEEDVTVDLVPVAKGAATADRQAKDVVMRRAAVH